MISESNIRVLVVEDELSIRRFISINLKRNSFDVLEASSGEEALNIVKVNSPDVVILDIMLPGIDGFEVCSRIRESHPEAAIIMLTAKGQDMDKLMGLELGADDYMVKPFNPLELVARIRAILRRLSVGKEHNSKLLSSGPFSIDLTAQKLYKNGDAIELTPKELSIMKLFLENQNKAFSRDELLDIVWGQDFFGDFKTVDVHIRRLREKLEDNSSKPVYIETVWGFGYRFVGVK